MTNATLARPGIINLPSQYRSQHSILTEKEIFSALDKNQDGDAELFVKLNKNKICFDHSNGRWYRFNGVFWEEDKVGYAMKLVETIIPAYVSLAKRYGNLAAQCVQNNDNDQNKSYESKRNSILNRIKSIHTLPRKNAILTLASQGDHSLGISGDEWDREPLLLPCPNGVSDLKTGELSPGRPQQYLRIASNTEYHPDAPYPTLFMQFLNDIFAENQEMISYIQRLFGYGLMGIIKDHIFIIFHGEGRNGKGTLLQILNHVLGPLSSPIKSSLLLDHGRTRPSSSPNPDILDLRGKRIVFCSETNPGSRFDPGIVKWLVGGDILVGRAVYGKHEVRFEPSHTMIMMTNHRPEAPAGGDDFAFWQRVQLVPFKISFVENPVGQFQRKIDKDLPEKLKNESQGILRWLVVGCLEYQRIGLKPPEAVKCATEEYKCEADDIHQFVQECCIMGSDLKIKSSVLHEAYKSWCSENGLAAKSQKRFGKWFTEKFEKKHSDGYWYLGLDLNGGKPEGCNCCLE